MYKRVLLKLSGEALSSPGNSFDPKILASLAKELKQVHELGVDLAIVVGGGNFIRGKMAETMGIERVQADYMGMLATVINALAVQSALEQEGVPTRVQTAIEMQKVAEPFIVRRANRHLEKSRVVIFGAGTGNPYFSTDTATVLMAIEVEADVILSAKAIDGVYDSDPKTNPNAKKYDTMPISEIVDKKLGVIDLAAAVLAMENKMPMMLFGLNDTNSIEKAVTGGFTGTTVTVE